jgi:hypothetical protein
LYKTGGFSSPGTRRNFFGNAEAGSMLAGGTSAEV